MYAILRVWMETLSSAESAIPPYMQLYFSSPSKFSDITIPGAYLAFSLFNISGGVPIKGPHLGYDRKGFLRTGTGNRICTYRIPVLITRTGIYFLAFRFRSNRNWNFKYLFRFRLNWNRKLNLTGFLSEFTGISFPKNQFYSKSVYLG
jgi:hypothetical protein